MDPKDGFQITMSKKSNWNENQFILLETSLPVPKQFGNLTGKYLTKGHLFKYLIFEASSVERKACGSFCLDGSTAVFSNQLP